MEQNGINYTTGLCKKLTETKNTYKSVGGGHRMKCEKRIPQINKGSPNYLIMFEMGVVSLQGRT